MLYDTVRSLIVCCMSRRQTAFRCSLFAVRSSPFSLLLVPFSCLRPPVSVFSLCPYRTMICDAILSPCSLFPSPLLVSAFPPPFLFSLFLSPCSPFLIIPFPPTVQGLQRDSPCHSNRGFRPRIPYSFI